MSTFNYSPLHQHSNEIRLIRLQPATELTSDIECELIHVSLPTAQPFEALSYTWGSPSISRNIIVDGKKFSITDNLHSALLTLRDSSAIRYLWIDAIYINQTDVGEKNREVPRMMQIYQAADVVVVWLGEASEVSSLAFDHLQLLSNQFHDEHPTEFTARWTLRYKSSLRIAQRCITAVLLSIWRHPLSVLIIACIHFIQGAMSWTTSLLLQGVKSGVGLFLFWNVLRDWRAREKREIVARVPDEATITALRDIFSRSWFRRTWIIREIAASRSAIVHCGNRTIAWKSLRNACLKIHSNVDLHGNFKNPYMQSCFQHMRYVDHIVQLDLRGDALDRYLLSHRDLLYLMNNVSALEATDPRDKVFGVLGLSNKITPLNPLLGQLKPTYEKPVQQVYVDVARYLILATGRLDILRACLGSGTVKGLPSWTPDWTVKLMRDTAGIPRWRKPFSLSEAEGLQSPVADFSADSK
jgi:hypothetical protein